MRIEKIIGIIGAATVLHVAAANAQELLNVRFHGTCSPGGNQSLTGGSGKGNSTKMTDADLIDQVIGAGNNSGGQNFALAYNTTADSIQVINTSDDSVVADVFQFAGGTGVTNNDGVSRLTFVFTPGKTEAIGSAVITERSNNGNGRPRLIGRLQLTMPEGGLGGGTNSMDGTSTNTNAVSIIDTNGVTDISNAVQVCTGTFTASSSFGNHGSNAKAKLSKQQKRANKLVNTQQNKQGKKANKQSALAGSVTTTNTTVTGGTNDLSVTTAPTTPGSLTTGTTGTTGSTTTGSTTTISSTTTTGSTPTPVTTIPGSTTTGSTTTTVITPPSPAMGGTNQVAGTR